MGDHPHPHPGARRLRDLRRSRSPPPLPACPFDQVRAAGQVLVPRTRPTAPSRPIRLLDHGPRRAPPGAHEMHPLVSKHCPPRSPRSDIEQPDGPREGREPGARDERPDRGEGFGVATHLIEAGDRLRRESRSPPGNGPGMRGVAHLQAIEGDEVDLDAEAWAPPRHARPAARCLRQVARAHAIAGANEAARTDLSAGQLRHERPFRPARTRSPTPCRRPRRPRSARTARPSAPSGRAAASPGVRRSPRTGVPG